MASNTDPIILKLELQEAQAKVNIKKLKQELDRLDGRTNEYKLSVKKLQVEEQKLVKIQDNRVTQNKRLNNSLGTLKKGLDGTSASTGAASASAMELSRVISDAPYGIRGMANNITQLVSQLGYQASATNAAGTATIGYTGAIKAMWASLKGPLGVVFAITAVVSAFDFFFGANKKAEKSVKESTASIGVQAAKLKGLKQAIESNSMSRKEANEAVNAANKEFKELNLQLDENNQLTSDSVDRINEKTTALINLSKAQALSSLLEQKYSELLPLQAKQQELDTDAKNASAKAMKQLNTLDKRFTAETQINNAAKAESAAKENAKAVKKIEEDIQKLIKLAGDDGIIDLMFKGSKGGRGRKIKLLSIDDFDKQLEDYLSQIAGVEEKEEILLAKLESDKILIQEKYHLERLEAKNKENQDKFKQQATAYRIEYKAFLDQQVRLGKMTKAEAKANLDNFDNDITAQQEASQANFNTLISKTKGFYFEKLFLALQSEQKETEIIKNENQKKIGELAFYVEQYKALMSGISSFLDGEAERQLTIEQNKTNVLNKELNDRLLNENLSKEQRKSIQTEIWQNDEKLRVVQEKIAKKKFNTAKAFNISMALADTYLGAQKAYISQLSVPTIDAPVRAKVAAAVATVSGLANVAAIARQKFQSTSAATPPVGSASSGGSGGVGDREFNFNLVGNTQTNQLAEAIQGQFSQPLKAFVVSKDVTTQQELDANIKGTATF